MQQRSIIALLLLAALAFGLVGGAHPCSEWQERGEDSAAVPSCHAGMKTAPHDAAARPGVPSNEHDSSKGCGTSCKHACHLTAVAETRVVGFAIAPVAQAVVEAPVSRLSRFSPPIDHIPLA